MRFKLPEGRTIRVLFHACDVQKPIFSLGCLAHQGYWSDPRADTDTSLLTKSQPNTAKHSCTRKRVCAFVKVKLMEPLGAAGVSDDDAQELQMAVGMLKDVVEPMPARPATLRDPGTPDQIVLDQHSLTRFSSQPWCSSGATTSV